MSSMEAVLAAPDDDAPRLAYADAIADRDPARAEFIRAQCALAALAFPFGAAGYELRRRALQRFPSSRPSGAPMMGEESPEQTLSVLCRDIRGDWVPEIIRRVAVGCAFRRGFVHGIILDAAAFANHAAEILSAAPVQHAALLSGPHQLDAIRAALDAPEVARLRSLSLRGGNGSDAAAALIADAPHLSDMRYLDLSENRLTAAGIAALGRSPHLGALASLRLRSNLLRAAGTEALAASPLFGRLTMLDLTKCGLGGKGVLPLAEIPGQLEELWLYENQITAEAIRALVRAPWARGLTTLRLGGGKVGGKGMVELAESGLTALVDLELRSAQLTSADLQMLSISPMFREVRRLDVSFNHGIEDGAIAALFGAERPARLRTLIAESCGRIGDAALAALADSAQASELALLDASHWNVTGEGAAALARSPHLGDLRWVNLRATKITAAGHRKLAEAPALRDVDTLATDHGVVQRSESASASVPSRVGAPSSDAR